jgi:hypothetical protein
MNENLHPRALGFGEQVCTYDRPLVGFLAPLELDAARRRPLRSRSGEGASSATAGFAETSNLRRM